MKKYLVVYLIGCSFTSRCLDDILGAISVASMDGLDISAVPQGIHFSSLWFLGACGAEHGMYPTNTVVSGLRKDTGVIYA